MKVFVKVKAGERREHLEQVDDRHFLLSVKEQPVDGHANEAVCRAIGRYFGAPPTSVRVVFGHTARQKIVDVPFGRAVADDR